jgi:DNA-directed RNA polymerase III subunit RPC2
VNYASFCPIKRYAAPITVDIEYSQGSPNDLQIRIEVIDPYYYYYPSFDKYIFYNCNNFFLQPNIIIGRLPIMLRSCCCVLDKRDEAELAKLGLFYSFNCFINLLHFSFFK